MLTAIDALGVGAALFDKRETITFACPRFAALAGRSRQSLVGVQLGRLVRRADRSTGRLLLARMWESQTPSRFVAATRRPDEQDFLVESCVLSLSGAESTLGLLLSRPIRKTPVKAAETLPQESVAAYAIDMTSQMAGFAITAGLPLMYDLLRVAAEIGKHESGIADVPNVLN